MHKFVSEAWFAFDKNNNKILYCFSFNHLHANILLISIRINLPFSIYFCHLRSELISFSPRNECRSITENTGPLRELPVHYGKCRSITGSCKFASANDGALFRRRQRLPYKLDNVYILKFLCNAFLSQLLVWNRFPWLTI